MIAGGKLNELFFLKRRGGGSSEGSNFPFLPHAETDHLVPFYFSFNATPTVPECPRVLPVSGEPCWGSLPCCVTAQNSCRLLVRASRFSSIHFRHREETPGGHSGTLPWTPAPPAPPRRLQTRCRRRSVPTDLVIWLRRGSRARCLPEAELFILPVCGTQAAVFFPRLLPPLDSR